MPNINKNIQRLPKHLKQFIVDQNYEKYTAVDHAVWRYIMRLNYDFLQHTAHESYLKGLEATGISIDRIPKIDEMNTILSKIGWGAVCVDGFIPPAAFMEFQAYKVLVIAADMRHINHIEYTPAPDIVHEAAGHAPIIVDPAYAEYLRLFGEIGSKALSSKRDYDLYEAVRKLSILKENPDATDQEIKSAELDLERISNDMGPASEMAKLRNLHWWTVEYGLIGDVSQPQIYGAGLLSSIGESESCLKDKVQKIGYGLEAADYNFDITTQQPQLFVTSDFSHLIHVLNMFADQMAFRKGGLESVLQAIESQGVNTCQMDSGIQISGVFTKVIETIDNEIAYINTTGPTMLSESNRMLIGHDTSAHKEGFGTPVGTLASPPLDLHLAKVNELKENNIEIGKECTLKFHSGVEVKGRLQYIRQNSLGRNLLMSFVDCTVRYNEQILFMPEWGTFDMAIGTQVDSVFSGAADKAEYEDISHVSKTNTICHNYTDQDYIKLYQQVRDLREQNSDNQLETLIQTANSRYAGEWLLLLELYELAMENDSSLSKELHSQLLKLSEEKTELNKLIKNGLSLLSSKN